MAKKYITFNYFEVQLIPTEVHIRNEIDEDFDQSLGDNNIETWDMKNFFDYLSTHRESFTTTVTVGDEYSEIEKDTYYYDEKRDLYHFQLSKLREKNIPSKKRFGEIKEDILLGQDEYIGEFNSIIYDNSCGALLMQSNFYGLTVKQTENVLTNLRFRYLDEIRKSETNPLVVNLAPIIDKSKVERIMDAGYYKKIRIKGSDVMLDANLPQEGLLCKVKDALLESAGVNIELTISLGRAPRTRSLDEDAVQQVITQFKTMEHKNKIPQIEITAVYDEESDVETINLIEPRMTDRISVDVEPRQTVGHEYLYNQFMAVYDKRRADVRRVMVPLLK